MKLFKKFDDEEIVRDIQDEETIEIFKQEGWAEKAESKEVKTKK